MVGRPSFSFGAQPSFQGLYYITFRERRTPKKQLILFKHPFSNCVLFNMSVSDLITFHRMQHVIDRRSGDNEVYVLDGKRTSFRSILKDR